MSDRARLSKRETYTASNGAEFFGSKDFPRALISSVQSVHPKDMLFGTSDIKPRLSKFEEKYFGDIFNAKIKGKRLLVCSGENDKLVPYRFTEPFTHFLKEAADGWYKEGNLYIEDNTYPVGHEYSDGMVIDTIRFVTDTLIIGTPKSVGTGAAKI
jgi:hypothetical protein